MNLSFQIKLAKKNIFQPAQFSSKIDPVWICLLQSVIYSVLYLFFFSSSCEKRLYVAEI